MQGRHCTKCKENKKAEDFRTNGVHPDGRPRLRSICKACGSLHKLEHIQPKVCPDCGVEKPASEFSENGRHTYCRPCANERSNKYKRGKGRAAHTARMSKYFKHRYKNDPMFRLKHAARQAVLGAVRVGVLKRPSHCPHCGRETRLQGHHHNGYAKEHWLDVVWLCARCHRQEEAA